MAQNALEIQIVTAVIFVNKNGKDAFLNQVKNCINCQKRKVTLCSNCFCVLKPDPCNPSPCGPGAQCMEDNRGNAVCRFYLIE